MATRHRVSRRRPGNQGDWASPKPSATEEAKDPAVEGLNAEIQRKRDARMEKKKRLRKSRRGRRHG